MVGIDPDFMSHKLNVNLSAKPKMQRRRKMSPEKLEAVRAEIAKLLSAGHIRDRGMLSFLDAYSGYTK